MPEKLKSKIYKTVVRPVALYSAECWPSTLKHDRMLHAMEMRMLRWSLGVTRRDRVRNDDIRGRLGVAPITKKMREARLRWYGHVIRSEENSVAARAMHLHVQGKRPRGRPKRRWLDRINLDIKSVGAEPVDALDRSKWRKICREADPAPTGQC